MTRLPLVLILLCGAAGAGHCQAQQLGRLFLSPQERVALDRQRNAGRADPVAADSAPAAEAAPPPVIVLNGVLTRSGSPRTVAWVDGVPQEGSLKGGKLVVRGRDAAAGVSLRLPSGARVTVKPGQQVDTASGRVREQHEAPPPSVGTARPETGSGQDR